MRISWAVPCLAMVMFSAPLCWAIPEGLPASTPEGAAGEGRAAAAYNEGLALAEKGDLTSASAPAEEAKQAYAAALDKFREATQLDPEMPGGWNMLGYTERKLGNYESALTAYGRALALRPNFPEAIEYRGEAFLGLNRIADAKQAYLDLFGMSRVLADKYLDAIEGWIEARRKAPNGVAKGEIKQLEQWIKERRKIGAATASLTREHAAEGWR